MYRGERTWFAGGSVKELKIQTLTCMLSTQTVILTLLFPDSCHSRYRPPLQHRSLTAGAEGDRRLRVWCLQARSVPPSRRMVTSLRRTRSHMTQNLQKTTVLLRQVSVGDRVPDKPWHHSPIGLGQFLISIGEAMLCKCEHCQQNRSCKPPAPPLLRQRTLTCASPELHTPLLSTIRLQSWLASLQRTQLALRTASSSLCKSSSSIYIPECKRCVC